MYNSVVRLSAAVLTAAVLCGCGIKKDAAVISLDTVEYETDTATVHVERPDFAFMKNKVLMDELNKAYEEETDAALIAFDTKSQDGGALRGGNKNIFEIYQNIKYNKNNFISIVSDSYEYTGGTHGSSLWTVKNVDLISGEEIALEDLFTDDSYKNALDNLIIQTVEAHPDEYSDLWEKPQIKESNHKDFYLSDDGLVIFYQPYDLSYYARGFVEFTLYYDDIAGYMKEDYKRLMK